jgi:hypothetical protein
MGIARAGGLGVGKAHSDNSLARLYGRMEQGIRRSLQAHAQWVKLRSPGNHRLGCCSSFLADTWNRQEWVL